MKTQQMTRAQLREAIAELRGEDKCFAVTTDKQRREIEFYNLSKEYLDIPEVKVMPDYLGSMDAAMPLLRELPLAHMEYVGDAILFIAFQSKRTGKIEFHEGRTGNEAEAIACAWWQWTTREIVEICE
jgi:hypothetical protein